MRGRSPGAPPAASGLGAGRSSPPSSLPPSLSSPLPLVFPWPWVWGTDLCSSQRECPLAADELRMVQRALLELVLELLTPSSLAEDLQVVLSFLAAAGDAGQVGWRPVTGRLGEAGVWATRGGPARCEPVCPQVLGALNLLLALLGSSAQELVAGFLLEPGNLEVLLALLVRLWSLPQLPRSVCKVRPAHRPWCPSCCGRCPRPRAACGFASAVTSSRGCRPPRSCTDCSRWSTCLSTAASGFGSERVASRGSSPACRKGRSPSSSAGASTSCSWAQVPPAGLGGQARWRGDRAPGTGRWEEAGAGGGAGAEPAGEE